MLIIIDHKIPAEAKHKLSGYGEVIELNISGITHEYISSHPDIYFCEVGENLICAPNLPEEYFHILQKHNTNYCLGNKPVGKDYPNCALYNAVVTDKYFIHKQKISDGILLQHVVDKKHINVKQGLTRCSLAPINKDYFITSDTGIYNSLKKYNLDVLFVNPEEIILPEMKYGLFGGCCGVAENKLFLLGSLKYFAEGEKVEAFLKKHDIELIELYDGALFDGGSVLFVGN